MASEEPLLEINRHRQAYLLLRSSIGNVSEMLNGKSVLFVEDSDDLREMFVELVWLLLERHCLGVGSYEELVARGEEALRCTVAILDINLGPGRPSGIDAYVWLRNKGYTGRVVFLTGHASNHPLVVDAKRIGDAEIFSKPIEPDRLRCLVDGDR